MSNRAVAQEQIDSVLRSAVEAREVPGVVALAASDKGAIYDGAFGVRDLNAGGAMTGDTVFRIASMTKAITSVAAMQLVEQGKLGLDEPVPPVDPALNAPQVLEGFDAAGQPKLRPAKRPITLRHLLTHTAGFTYEWSNPNTRRYVQTTGMLPGSSGKLAALRQPLAFDPGDKWEYGINIDWVGRIVETVSGQPLGDYLRDKICAPLGMSDTGFTPTVEQRARLTPVHQRQADGTLVPTAYDFPIGPEFHNGGGALYSTGRDYLTFLRMLLHDGELNGQRVLRPETVALINRNQIGDLQAGRLPSRVLAGRMPGVGMTERGRAEIASQAERLATEKIAAIYASPLQRTRESAEIVSARLGLPIELRDDLLELDFGEWTGTTFDAIRADPRWQAWSTQRSLSAIPGGESMREVQQRVVAALLELNERHLHETVVLVSHGDVIRAVLLFALGMPLDFYNRIEIGQGSISTINIGASAIRVTTLGERPPLPSSGSSERAAR